MSRSRRSSRIRRASWLKLRGCVTFTWHSGRHGRGAFNSHAFLPPPLLPQDAAKAMARDEEGASETRSAPPVPEHFRVWASANASYAQPTSTRPFFFLPFASRTAVHSCASPLRQPLAASRPRREDRRQALEVAGAAGAAVPADHRAEEEAPAPTRRRS
jgi:hypothetical protein